MFVYKNIQTKKKEKYKKQAAEPYLETCEISRMER